MYSYARTAYFSPMQPAMRVRQVRGRSSLLICIVEETVGVLGRQQEEAKE